jgi:hypothetical protein
MKYEGAIYHVMARGDHRKKIVHDDEDRRRFEATLVKGMTCRARLGTELLLLYCLSSVWMDSVMGEKRRRAFQALDGLKESS